MKNYEEKLKKAWQIIVNSKNVLLIGHLSPDSDALSSVSVFIDVLSSLQIDYYAFTLLKKENEYEYIPHSEKIQNTPPKTLKNFDAIIVFDCGSIERTALEKEILETKINKSAYIIDIDHHQKASNYADIEIRRQDKASTSMIVYDVLKANNWPITKNISEAVLSGIIGDTGCFTHSNSSAEAIKVAAETLSYGAAFHKIIKESTNKSNLLSLKIWGKMIDNIHFNRKTGLISSGITEKELNDLEDNEEDDKAVEDLFGIIVSFICSIKDVKVALLLREEKGIIKGSLRTNQDYIDVSKIASQFGGGGHKKAAGFSRKGYLERTETGWKIRNIQK
ncbi:MAG: DHH family phosphoesterase [Patescibacteria group bacterium]|jgi:phosphoesterase RecJ-like protein|nr:DHH family phosphoesterase [Patescibacteria group bacterium]